MRKAYLLMLALIGLNLFAQNPDDMVLEYEITTANSKIVLPLGGTVNVTVNWGDGNTESFTTPGEKTHTYTNTGTYMVSLSGSLTAYGENSFAFNRYLIKVKNFGNLGLISLKYAFQFANDLVEVPSSLPSTVTDLSRMFYKCSKFNSDISLWNTQNVTNMSGMFLGASSFNQPIGLWNTQNVIDMSGMFNDASSFNQPIGDWNTQNVVNMNGIFYLSTSFNQPIGNWNTQNVTNMSQMFTGAKSFNQSIGDWDTRNVTDMTMMFVTANSFNQPIGDWDTRNVINMGQMFEYAPVFNQPIGNWNTQNVTNMISMFHKATSFNQFIGSWNTQNVTNMQGMFSDAISFNQPIGSWNTQNVIDMDWMFSRASSFNQPIGSWNMQNVQSIYTMFYDAISFNQNLGSWNLKNVNYPNSRDTGSIFSPNVPISSINYDSTLIGLAKNATNMNFYLGKLKTKYSSCEAQDARQKLINIYKWKITDGGLDGTACVVTETNDALLQDDLMAYPSPAQDFLHINLPEGSIVELCSSQGMVSLIKVADQQIDMRTQPRGVYMLKTTTSRQKVVLEHK